MSTESLQRPALGQAATLGMLYDARSDTFLSHSVLSGAAPNEIVNRIDVDTRHQVISNDTYKDVFKTMEISPELGASFLARFFRVGGSGGYLSSLERDATLTAHRALHSTIITSQESLNVSGDHFRNHLNNEIPSNIYATHVVTGIKWGARCIVAATQTLTSEDERPEIEGRLESAFEIFKRREELESDRLSSAQLGEIAVYSDMLEYNENPPNNLYDAYKHFLNLPGLVNQTNDVKTRPLAYTLLPVNFFSLFFGIRISAAVLLGDISRECQEKFVKLLDDLHVAQGLLSNYYQRLVKHLNCVKPSDIVRVFNLLRDSEREESSLRSSYTRSLNDIRAGRKSPQDISQLIEAFLQGDFAPEDLTAITFEYTERMCFVDLIEGKGATYVGYDGLSRQEFTHFERYENWGDAYIFYFKDTMKNTQSWKEHIELLNKILDDMDRKERVFIVDCEATGTQVEELCIHHFQDNSLVTKNVLKQRKYLADKCLLRYDRQYLDATVKDDPWPPRRKMVKIPCPGESPNCTSHNHDWICFKCYTPVEYGTVNSYMYCECGRVPCSGLRYEFNCQQPGHGSNWAKYRDKDLLNKMKALNPPPEVNILILGETGVGKSTFINAFINYLTFSSLDHALSAPELNWVIPCSFATSNEAADGRIVPKVVKIGLDPDEVSGVRGKSATQKATAYPIYIEGKLVRLIDTPGIGDTRGLEQDKENMIHTLSVLRNYETLHGIMILLKPNNARLGLMFKYCINELLTHLHRDAVDNMVFGFTNTRGSMYKPGDALGPLEEHLRIYGGSLPELYSHTVYCFDSESFRYLAARMQQLDLGDIEDYRRSWEHSARESRRLMAYFQARNPHSVKSMLTLAETREVIVRLVEPMAEVIKVVCDSITKNTKAMEELSTTEKTGKALVGLLNLTEVKLETEQLKDPYTVCDNEACVSRVPGLGGEMVALRKSLCHDPCSLTEISRGVRGAKGITGCLAFENGICGKCSHTPDDHMHIMVLYAQKTVTTVDPVVQAKLNENASDFQIKEAQINALRQKINEYQKEQDLLERAQAQFSYYLEKNSITVYNDVTIEYLDHLIRDERAKGTSNRILIDALEKSKKQHLKFIEAMRKGKKAQMDSQYQSLDDGGVLRLIYSLCAMKYYGNQLKNAVAAVEGAYQAQFRERPYRIRTREPYMLGASGSSASGSSASRSGASEPMKSGSGKPRPKTMIFDEGRNFISSTLSANSQTKTSKKVLNAQQPKDMDNMLQLAPPPYENPVSVSSASSHVIPNRHLVSARSTTSHVIPNRRHVPTGSTASQVIPNINPVTTESTTSQTILNGQPQQNLPKSHGLKGFFRKKITNFLA